MEKHWITQGKTTKFKTYDEAVEVAKRRVETADNLLPVQYDAAQYELVVYEAVAVVSAPMPAAEVVEVVKL